jgi:hypothetical protein
LDLIDMTEHDRQLVERIAMSLQCALDAGHAGEHTPLRSA